MVSSNVSLDRDGWHRIAAEARQDDDREIVQWRHNVFQLGLWSYMSVIMTLRTL